jgi:hypothetical protein
MQHLWNGNFSKQTHGNNPLEDVDAYRRITFTWILKSKCAEFDKLHVAHDVDQFQASDIETGLHKALGIYLTNRATSKLSNGS